MNGLLENLLYLIEANYIQVVYEAASIFHSQLL